MAVAATAVVLVCALSPYLSAAAVVAVAAEVVAVFVMATAAAAAAAAAVRLVAAAAVAAIALADVPLLPQDHTNKQRVPSCDTAAVSAAGPSASHTLLAALAAAAAAVAPFAAAAAAAVAAEPLLWSYSKRTGTRSQVERSSSSLDRGRTTRRVHTTTIRSSSRHRGCSSSDGARSKHVRGLLWLPAG